ncbi:carbon monoxide dehydrogenase subunit G [Thermosporothrix hazakensis]|uniref:Carbon monoxide dehydrogenase subunit G n=2 Tax=Thermosporothrix TaxID=768650 RepID=A0A326TVV9_THEHA|nr:SRPBCC domain-containing protein [Thermosporothrix hazakensis]PZW19735.1 carbon monoxide dehydrogenase subunit G [Thermosporothrix hazakensis]BBH90550.1 hypothetical protein KTC_53010 [Thermosporothrix sp. COM3]GCE48603.1 hypothetical protein KTH_34720 [Thermosporothrix hazakensis]
MNIEGTYTLQAPLEEVWQCLSDEAVLRQALPGLEQIKRLDKDVYEITLNVKQAPLAGRYTGRVTIDDLQYPYFCRFTITGEGEQQNCVNGDGVIHLNERNGNTILAYKGSLAFGNLSARLTVPMARGAAKHLTQQFFMALADQLRSRRGSSVATAEREEPVVQTRGDIIIIPPPELKEEDEAVPLTLKCVRLLGIGAHNPEEEQRWAKRIRQIGLISLFLFLVWVGTRLPRRK